jgi:ferric-dicitrate binding protein FerR (iron transport regulator)
MSDSPVGPDDVRAAAQTYRELGPDYHDAVIASFVDRIDREVDARVEARLAELAAAPPPLPPARRKRRHVLRGTVAAGAGALAVLAAVAGVAVTGSHTAPATRAVRIEPGPGGGKVIVGPHGQRIVVQGPQAPRAPQAPQPPG